MFSLAYVILPFSDVPPAKAITASLARFQSGLRGDVPEEWLSFDDETALLRQIHEAPLTFTDRGQYGLQIEGDPMSSYLLDLQKVRREMRQHGRESLSIRFADQMDLDTFFERYGRDQERHPSSNAYGRWRNLLGRWDWWDLGGRFDGHILGEGNRGTERRTAAISSGDNPGRAILAGVEHALRNALNEQHPGTVEVHADRNIEMASTLLTDAKAGREHAFPGSLVLPPGVVTDYARWLGTWPKLGPVRAFEWLGLSADATWSAVCQAAYKRFEDHWVAGVAYHC